MTFIDHYNYTQADIEEAKKKIINSTAEIAVTTTKDMVKLSQLDLSGLDIYNIETEFKLSQGDEKKLMDIIGV
jgi:tetraacyldisaccharide-1-P 4'-kinase